MSTSPGLLVSVFLTVAFQLCCIDGWNLSFLGGQFKKLTTVAP